MYYFIFFLEKVNMRELEAAAKASATTKVINTLNRPGQLEKIDQIKQRYVRKKASVEALLKSAMQQQLDGVRIGLNQLHRCLEEVSEINIRYVPSISVSFIREFVFLV